MVQTARQFGIGFDMPLMPQDVLVVVAAQKGWMTRLEIAQAMMRPKSPTLVAAINMCVVVGWLEAKRVELPNHIEMFQYRITDAGKAEMSKSP